MINAEQYLSGAAAYSAARLKDHLNYVSAIVTLAPLMGLLGTVTGMIRSFDILSISEGQPFAITGGVAEALVGNGVRAARRHYCNAGLCLAFSAGQPNY